LLVDYLLRFFARSAGAAARRQRRSRLLARKEALSPAGASSRPPGETSQALE